MLRSSLRLLSSSVSPPSSLAIRISTGRCRMAVSSPAVRCGGVGVRPTAGHVQGLRWMGSNKKRGHKNKKSAVAKSIYAAAERGEDVSHATGKKGKGKKNKKAAIQEVADLSEADDSDELVLADDDDEEEEEEVEEGPSLPDTEKLENRMSSAVASLERALRPVRGGEPTPDIFDHVMVPDPYGDGSGKVPLPSLAQIVLQSPNVATASCYDPSSVAAVRDAIAEQMDLNPYLDEGADGDVICPLPRISEESRLAVVKMIGTRAESSRGRIRKIRRRAHDTCRRGQAGKMEGVSKDDAFRVGKEVDAITEKYIQKVDRVLEEKSAVVMRD
mmetsp:Transcript_26683/g.41282  ORF Transcript_26683/g.41282 Transcript_26683/m.41282 type:complete len:330 (+) Transcript_26683:144-1133(+)